MEIVVDTLRDYHAEGYTIGLDCLKCGRQPDMDLAALVEYGHGDKPLRLFRPSCPKCRQPLLKIVQPPEKPGLLKDGKRPFWTKPT